MTCAASRQGLIRGALLALATLGTLCAQASAEGLVGWGAYLISGNPTVGFGAHMISGSAIPTTTMDNLMALGVINPTNLASELISSNPEVYVNTRRPQADGVLLRFRAIRAESWRGSRVVQFYDSNTGRTDRVRLILVEGGLAETLARQEPEAPVQRAAHIAGPWALGAYRRAMDRWQTSRPAETEQGVSLRGRAVWAIAGELDRLTISGSWRTGNENENPIGDVALELVTDSLIAAPPRYIEEEAVLRFEEITSSTAHFDVTTAETGLFSWTSDEGRKLAEKAIQNLRTAGVLPPEPKSPTETSDTARGDVAEGLFGIPSPPPRNRTTTGNPG
jgi:hypothetical protein